MSLSFSAFCGKHPILREEEKEKASVRTGAAAVYAKKGRKMN
jgi:hypothetical protein